MDHSDYSISDLATVISNCIVIARQMRLDTPLGNYLLNLTSSRGNTLRYRIRDQVLELLEVATSFLILDSVFVFEVESDTNLFSSFMASCRDFDG